MNRCCCPETSRDANGSTGFAGLRLNLTQLVAAVQGGKPMSHSAKARSGGVVTAAIKRQVRAAGTFSRLT